VEPAGELILIKEFGDPKACGGGLAIVGLPARDHFVLDRLERGRGELVEVAADFIIGIQGAEVGGIGFCDGAEVEARGMEVGFMRGHLLLRAKGSLFDALSKLSG